MGGGGERDNTLVCHWMETTPSHSASIRNDLKESVLLIPPGVNDHASVVSGVSTGVLTEKLSSSKYGVAVSWRKATSSGVSTIRVDWGK